MKTYVYDVFEMWARALVAIIKSIFLLPRSYTFELGRCLQRSLEHYHKANHIYAMLACIKLVLLPINIILCELAIIVFHLGAALLSLFGILTGLDEKARALSELEFKMLRSIYGTQLALKNIRIRPSTMLTQARISRVVGNTIYMPKKAFEYPSTMLRVEYTYTFLHEVAHVWQNQHLGSHYMPHAIWANLAAIIQHSNRNQAYDWLGAMRSGIPAHMLNPEAQAELIAAWSWYVLNEKADSSPDTDNQQSTSRLAYMKEASLLIQYT